MHGERVVAETALGRGHGVDTCKSPVHPQIYANTNMTLYKTKV